jgi:hypothetical protein
MVSVISLAPSLAAACSPVPARDSAIEDSRLVAGLLLGHCGWSCALMGQGAFVLENLSKVTAVRPSTAGRTSDEVLGLVLRRVADELADILAAPNVDHQ